MSGAAKLDALVVGAGPVGLTAAAELFRLGLNCRIVDKAAARTDKSKALVLWPRTLELLATSGAVEPFLAAGTRVVRAGLYGAGKCLADIDLGEFPSPYPFALMLPQSETERLLVAHLNSLEVEVERGVELLDFSADANGITARLRDAGGREETVRTAWLLGCDGAQSRVRRGLGIEFEGEAEPGDWIIADVCLDGDLPPDEARIYSHETGILAVFPIAPKRFRLVADRGPAAPTERPPEPSLEEVREVVTVRGPEGLAVRDPSWLAGFRIDERKVGEYRAGRVFLAGDAAHVLSPAGGQGMNTGMQDVYNLAWKLALVHAGRGRGEVLLDSYSSERGAAGDEILRNSRVLTRLASLRQPAAQQLRNALVPVLTSFDFLRERGRDSLAELGIQYRRSPISRDDRGVGVRARTFGSGIAAGDRAPDASLTDARSGKPAQLFGLYNGLRHVLLLCRGDANGEDSRCSFSETAAAVQSTYPDLVDVYTVAPSGRPGAVPLLFDRAGEVRKTYAVQNATGVLIRPDGYIGYYGQPLDPGRLLAHMATYLR